MWEVTEALMSQCPHHVGRDWEPFAVCDKLIYFRRQVPEREETHTPLSLTAREIRAETLKEVGRKLRSIGYVGPVIDELVRGEMPE